MRPLLVALALLAAAPSANASPATEVNVLWPTLGISELKLLLPVTERGEVVLGTYFDYAQFIRSGRAFIIGAKPGYRYFISGGFHVELTAVVGVRHETMHPGDDATLNDFYIRAFPALGYQHDFSPRFYMNTRAMAGLLVYRQTHWAEEKKVALAVDLNLGVRF